MVKPKLNSLEPIVSLCKRRGFVFPGSSIYGGFANSYDYGPLGVLLKQKLSSLWWSCFVHHPTNQLTKANAPAKLVVHGLDSSILQSTKVWKASGHLENFTDPFIRCMSCMKTFRADKLIEDTASSDAQMTDLQNLEAQIKSAHQHGCPCGKQCPFLFSPPKPFNLMFKTQTGLVEEDEVAYFRPETAQGAYINFQNVFLATGEKLPFGIAQSGKSFRNEITPGNFIFRTREFEQLELQWFYQPDSGGDSRPTDWYQFWIDYCYDFLTKTIGLSSESLRLRHHDPAELAHYSVATCDIEYNFPGVGWGELWGIADRGNYDLQAHSTHSKIDLSHYHRGDARTKVLPSVIEPAVGLNRLLLAILCDGYAVETVGGTQDQRTVLRFQDTLAPYTFAVLPLRSNDTAQGALCEEVEETIRNWGAFCNVTAVTEYPGSIGKRYRRQDEIGTPYCVAVDRQSLDDRTVTIRERDTMTQIRTPIDSFSSKEKLFQVLADEF